VRSDRDIVSGITYPDCLGCGYCDGIRHVHNHDTGSVALAASAGGSAVRWNNTPLWRRVEDSSVQEGTRLETGAWIRHPRSSRKLSRRIDVVLRDRGGTQAYFGWIPRSLCRFSADQTQVGSAQNARDGRFRRPALRCVCRLLRRRRSRTRSRPHGIRSSQGCVHLHFGSNRVVYRYHQGQPLPRRTNPVNRFRPLRPDALRADFFRRSLPGKTNPDQNPPTILPNLRSHIPRTNRNKATTLAPITTK